MLQLVERAYFNHIHLLKPGSVRLDIDASSNLNSHISLECQSAAEHIEITITGRRGQSPPAIFICKSSSSGFQGDQGRPRVPILFLRYSDSHSDCDPVSVS
jgi:hypothetical protein